MYIFVSSVNFNRYFSVHCSNCLRSRNEIMTMMMMMMMMTVRRSSPDEAVCASGRSVDVELLLLQLLFQCMMRMTLCRNASISSNIFVELCVLRLEVIFQVCSLHISVKCSEIPTVKLHCRKQ